MRTKCYSVRLQSLRQISPKAYIAEAFDGSEAIIPASCVFGADYDTHDGTGVRDYIHVVDLALGHVKALTHNQTNKGVGVFNLGTGIGYSVLDLVKAFEDANGIEIKYEITDRRAGDNDIAYADASHAKKELGWVAARTLVDMCRDSWNWQSNNPNGYDAK